MKAYFKLIAASIGLTSSCVFAETELNKCIEEGVLKAADNVTVGEIRNRCLKQIGESTSEEDEPKLQLARRILGERASGDARFIIPHKRNYILPFTYVDEPNEEPFEDFAGIVDPDSELNNEEAKYQISLKIPLVENLFVDYDAIYFGFTIASFWQVYNDDISAPFRDTNYEPEFFWLGPLDWNPFEADASYLALGIVHQSNGRSVPLSRSWNRIYANFLWEEGPWVFSFKPWYRIPEDDKDFPLDTEGDDNPDIDDYLGYFEFKSVYQRDRMEIGLMLRNNLRSENRGAVQLDWSFPLWGRLKGHVQYFNGYGESLLDYDARIERIGIGILLTDLL